MPAKDIMSNLQQSKRKSQFKFYSANGEVKILIAGLDEIDQNMGEFWCQKAKACHNLYMVLLQWMFHKP